MTNDGRRIIEEILGVPGAQAQAAAVGKQQRADASQQQRSRHDEQLDGGTDPAYVTSQEPPPEAMTHQQIWDDVQRLDQQSIWNACVTWSQVSTSITTAFQMARIGMNRAVEGRWEGQAAEAGVAAMSAFATGGEHMGEVATSVAMRLDTMFYAAQALAGAVPPPPLVTVADPDNASESVLPWLVSGEKARGDDENATRLRALAVAAVNTTYLPTFPPSGADVPSFVAPPQIGEGGDNGAGAPTPGGAQSPTTPGTADAGTGAPADDPSSAVGPESSGTTAEGDAGASEQAGSTESAADSEAATTAAGAAPTTATPSAGTPPNANGQSPVGGTPGSGAGAPGSGGGTPGSAGGTPGVGAGLPVRGSAPGTGSAANASTAGSSTGRSGHGPMGPMAPGAGARKGQGDEETHQIPDYLRRVQEELVGHQSAIAPVIGDHTTEISEPGSEPRPEPLPALAADPALPRSLFSADDRPHQQPAPTSTPSPTAVPVAAAADPTTTVAAAATPTPAPSGPTPELTGAVPESAQTEAPAAQPQYVPITGSGPWDMNNPAVEPDEQREDQPPATTDSGGRP
ncbi:hypothetical protein [Nocardia mangyaensis]|uniref:hypothetical protein n=1 Tax=Nocardia mangyaensis TaxID=2213200 RepID=UPI0026752DA1|nr:hypothetical protein [Nocardia mangyaensis]MDO3651252.1 hypothetical protein [Nocardia mangyaensis]